MRPVDWAMIDRIPGWLARQEGEWLAEQAATAESWIELGTYVGRSALCVALHLPKNARLIVVDKNLGTQIDAGQTWETTLRQIVQHRPDLIIEAHRMQALDSARLVDAVDVAYIDSDHTEAGTTAQINAFLVKAKVLCGHDYCESWPGVPLAVDALIGNRLVRGPGSIWSRTLASQ